MRGRLFGVVEEHLVEIGPCEEERNRVGVLTLKMQVLLHCRREFGSWGHGSGGGGLGDWGWENKNARGTIVSSHALGYCCGSLRLVLLVVSLVVLLDTLLVVLFNVLRSALLVVGVSPAFHLIVLVSIDLVGDLLDGMFG